jgi:LPS export ABC transporter protein LptC
MHVVKSHIHIFSFLLLLFFAACENDIAVVNSITSADKEQLPWNSGKNVEMLYSDSAIVRAKLTAPQLDQYGDRSGGKKNYSEMPKGMLVIFYNSLGLEENRLKADYGISHESEKGKERMEAKRNVQVINQKGDKLETEHLIWDAATKEIYTDKFVKITTKEEVIWGDGLKANQDFSKYEILHPQGTIPIDDKQFNETKKTVQQ